MNKRYLYGAVDIDNLQVLAVGTNEDKIKDFIAGKADEKLKIFKVTTETGKSYKVKLSIDGFSPNLQNIEEDGRKMRELWGLIYMLEIDLAESNTEIFIFDRPKTVTR
ncbi:MAG: hypothetical protein WCZ89_05325 [Phycisphaerae bacterium]